MLVEDKGGRKNSRGKESRLYSRHLSDMMTLNDDDDQ